jgi:hypothetical protein
LQAAVGGRGTGEAIIGERDIVPDENLIFQRHTFTDECVARNLAAVANLGTLLDFHKGSNLHIIADFTTVKIGEIVNPDIFTQLDVRGDPLKFLLR